MHETHAAHVTDDRVFRLKFFEVGAEIGAGIGRVGFEVFFFDEINDGLGRSGGDGIAAEGGDVDAFPSFGHFGTRDCEADGEAVAETFGTGHNVGRDSPLFDAEPLIAGTSPAGLDFVTNEDAAVFADDIGDDLEVLFGRSDEAADALDGFCDHTGDAAGGGGFDEVFDILRALDVTGWICEREGAAIAIGIVREDDAGLGLRTDFPGRMTGEGESHGGTAVIGVAEGDDVGGTGVAAGEHDGGFVGFGAAVGEE